MSTFCAPMASGPCCGRRRSRSTRITPTSPPASCARSTPLTASSGPPRPAQTSKTTGSSPFTPQPQRIQHLPRWLRHWPGASCSASPVFSKQTKRPIPLQTGGSLKTATEAFSHCTSGTTPPTDMLMGACAACLRDQGKRSSFEPEQETPDLFGDRSSATAQKEASTAPFSETRVRSCRPSLSDRLTLSLMRSGLVAGTTPTSIRKRCGAAIPDTASNWLAGPSAEKAPAGN